MTSFPVVERLKRKLEEREKELQKKNDRIEYLLKCLEIMLGGKKEKDNRTGKVSKEEAD